MIHTLYPILGDDMYSVCNRRLQFVHKDSFVALIVGPASTTASSLSGVAMPDISENCQSVG